MRYKAFLRYLVWVMLGLSIGLLSLYICLPTIVETQVKRRLSPFLDGHTLDFKIDKIGLFNASLSRIQINNTTILDQVRLVYDLRKLSDIRIKSLILSGLYINGSLDENNQLTIQKIKLPEHKILKNKPGKTSKFDMSILSYLPYLPGRIRIQNSNIKLTAFNRQFFLPFDVMAIVNSDEKKIVIQSNVFPFGQKINTQITYDLNKGPEQFYTQAVSFDLESLNFLLSEKTKDVKLSGLTDFKLESKAYKTAWSFQSSRVGISKPFTGNIHNLDCDVKIADKKVRIDGSFLLNNSLVSNIGFNYNFIFDPLNTYPLSLQLHSKRLNTFNIAYNNAAISAHQPQIKFEMVANRQKGFGSVHFKSNRGNGEYQKEKVKFSSSKFDCSINFDSSAGQTRLEIKPDIVLNRLIIDSDQGDVSLPALHLSGVASYTKDDGLKAVLDLDAQNGKINLPDKKMMISGVNINFPIQYPEVKKPKKGRYQISKIVYDKTHTLGVSGRITQTGPRIFQIGGNILLFQLPNIHPQFDSQVNLTNALDALFTFSVNSFELTGKDIKKVLPQQKINADIKMTVKVDGNAKFSNHQLSTAMKLGISDGQVSIPDSKLTVKGIHSDITFNNILVPETVPGQVLTVDYIEVDKIKIHNATVRFSIEDATYFLIENLRFNWCKGIVSTEAIRFPQKNEDYMLILYCDRLGLAELLQQMGVFHAEGNGTLNGKIPIGYNDGKIFFDNGFLFSTPGSGGKVKIENTDRIIAGIPMDSPQFGQLDLASEALKDFDYKWAKLVINTFDDNLVINLELDGKPSKIMPFEFRKEVGGFVRVDDSNPGSKFQGIKLDVNLNLPFNEMMKFGNKLKSMFNQ